MRGSPPARVRACEREAPADLGTRCRRAGGLRISRKALLVALCLATLAYGLWLKFGSRLSPWTVDTVRTLVDAEVPRGTARQDVQDWARRHGFPWSDVGEANGKPSRQGYALIAPATVGGRTGGEIRAYFDFDDQDRRTGSWLRATEPPP